MAEYDPSKEYHWKEEDKFSMEGNQFGLILNVFRQFIAKPESQELMRMIKAEAEMTKILSDNVKSGVVTEVSNVMESLGNVEDFIPNKTEHKANMSKA